MKDVNSVVTDILSLRRSNYLDKLRNAVPLPRSVTPPDIGLPRWQRIPLDKRIPSVPGPQKVILARRKLGEPLRVELENDDDNVVKKRFDTSDPYNREISLPYEALHDPHLSRFFLTSTTVQDFLIKAGLLTEDLHVKCSLKEYNDYRNYLRQTHGKAMQRELEKRDDMQRETMILDVACKQNLKESERLKKDENRAKILRELRLRKEQKLRDLFDKWKRSNQHVRSMNHLKRQLVHEKIADAKLKRQLFQQKRGVMAKMEQQQTLNALKRFHERDVRLARTSKQNEMKKRDDKIKVMIDRFEKKKIEQEEMVDREECLKDCIEKIKKTFLEEYEKKLARSRKKLQELFVEKRKALEKLRTPEKKKLKKREICYCKVN